MTPLVVVAMVVAWAAFSVPVALVMGSMAAARDRQVPSRTGPAVPARVVPPALGAARPSR